MASAWFWMVVVETVQVWLWAVKVLLVSSSPTAKLKYLTGNCANCRKGGEKDLGDHFVCAVESQQKLALLDQPQCCSWVVSGGRVLVEDGINLDERGYLVERRMQKISTAGWPLEISSSLKQMLEARVDVGEFEQS